MARTITGVVTSDKADKTIVIAVYTRKTHPVYKKQYSVTTKFMAHDANNEAKEGDKVVIVETRPLSRRKRFTLKQIVETARVEHKEPEAEARKGKKAKEEAEVETTPAKAAKAEPKGSPRSSASKAKKESK